MNQIEKIEFNFDMQNEEFAQKLYGRWDTSVLQQVESVVDKILLRHDQPHKYLEIEQLDIDLGFINEDEFDDRFLLLLEEKLEEAITYAIFDPKQKMINKLVSEEENAFDVLCRFLLNGTISWNTEWKYKGISELFLYVLNTSGTLFKQFLLTYGHYTSLQERIVFQLKDPDLEKGITLLNSAESDFICSYVKLLFTRYQQLKQPAIRETDYRHTVWRVVYAYLFNQRSSYFNKKSFLCHTIIELAARYNLSYEYLLDVITKELADYNRELFTYSGLFKLLDELRLELTQKNRKESAFDAEELYRALSGVLQGKESERQDACSKTALIEVLSKIESCRSFLKLLSEPEIFHLVAFVMPEESEFVLSYASSLDKQKKYGALSGKAGGEFMHLKWQIIFPLLFENKGLAFNRKFFVRNVLQQVANHYNLSVVELYDYFCSDAIHLFDSDLGNIFQELYAEIREQMTVKKSNAYERTEWIYEMICQQIQFSATDTHRILEILFYEDARRILVSKLQEEEKCRLIELLYPLESGFIIAYAISLDRQQGKGILEGRAGGELHQLKWEFILAVLAGGRDTAFNRKYFVSSVIRSLAAHYNLEYDELLFYFYQQIQEHTFPSELVQVLKDLYVIQVKEQRTDHSLDTTGMLTEEINKETDIINNKMKHTMENKELTQENDLTAKNQPVFINNSGAVLLYPFLPNLFNRLNLLNERRNGFKDEASGIRAVFLIQYLVYGKTEFSEHELILNKYLTGLESETPLPRSIELTDEEKKMSAELLTSGFKNNWQKLKNTSVESLQQAFLQRPGKLEYSDDVKLTLTVEQKAYDMLLDSLPWSYSPIKHSWMNKIIIVKWRN